MDTLDDAEVTPVTATPASTLGGQYGTSPESPDASRICYVSVPQYLESAGKATYTAELKVCDRDATNHRTLCEVHNADLHNGLHHQWVTNDLIAIAPKGAGHSVRIVSAETGEIVHEPGEWMKIGQAAWDGSVLLTNARPQYPEAALDRPRGIYELDGRTGETQLVISAAEVASKKIQGGRPLHRADIDIVHLQYSPSGDRIAFLPDTDHVAVVATDGSELACFPGKKPMHFQWFDDESIFGHTDVGPETPGPDNPFCNDSPGDGKLYRWDLAQRAQVEELAGYGCHPAASPDRELYATEDWYGSNEISLRLYERGTDIPTATLFTTSHSSIIWGSQAHVNPAFSRDGSRIYFTKPTGPNSVQLCYTALGERSG